MNTTVMLEMTADYYLNEFLKKFRDEVYKTAKGLAIEKDVSETVENDGTTPPLKIYFITHEEIKEAITILHESKMDWLNWACETDPEEGEFVDYVEKSWDITYKEGQYGNWKSGVKDD